MKFPCNKIRFIYLLNTCGLFVLLPTVQCSAETSPYSQPVESSRGYAGTWPSYYPQAMMAYGEYSNRRANENTDPFISTYEEQEDEYGSRVKIGGDYTYLNFKPAGNTSLTGSLGGMQVMYEYRRDNCFYEGIEFSWKQGSVDATGISRSMLYLDAQERAGYTLGLSQIDFALSFFTGLGYRHYGQTLKVSGASPLRFTYNEFYVPVGVYSAWKGNGYFGIGLDLTWMPQIYPAVSIKPLKGAFWKLSYPITSFSVKLPITITPTKNPMFNITLTPFYEHWEDGQSTAEIASGVPLGLPANYYNFWGVNLNFLLRF